jgi:drug/metabolite transporter (DMT)-like permease
MGFMGGIAQILATNAYRLSDVSILSPIDYSSILWAITFGIIFFQIILIFMFLLETLLLLLQHITLYTKRENFDKKLILIKLTQGKFNE